VSTPALSPSPGSLAGRTNGRRAAWWQSVAVLVSSSLVACTGFGRKPEQPTVWPEIRADYRAEVLRASLREYSITFAAAVDLAATAIERRATDAEVKRNALLWKLRAIPELREACFRPEPVAALVDAWTFVRQMDHFLREGSGANVFGPFQPEALEVSGRLVSEMRAISDSIAVSPEARAELERQIVAPWTVDHPLRGMTFVRESPMARFTERSAARGDVFQSVGTIEESVSGLSHQARIYMADLPRQIRGEIDLLRADVLPPELLSSVQGDLHVAAAAAASIAETADELPGLVSRERQVVLDEVSRQRALVVAAIAAEREQIVGAIMRAFALEREQLLRAFDTQRRDTLDWATVERREAIGEVRQELAGAIGVLRGERAIVVDDMRRIVDMVLLRVALGLIAAVVLAPLVAHAYARVWPRR
jgi:hypothetical protein